MLLDRLAEDLRLKPEYIELVARTASHRYKTYSIPKKNGGLRTIHHPARELKLMQSWLVEKVFARFPVHRAATAYKKGASILLNATRHKKNNYLLKVDFENFFPSITGPDIVQLFQKSTLAGTRRIFSLPEVEFIRQIVCRGDRLTIGAPSSPMISNIVMFEFDQTQAVYCRNHDIVYSRYADDLYFSTNAPQILGALLDKLRHDLADQKSPILRINEKKTVFTSRKRRRIVTGLVLTPTGVVSLGRQRKRFIRSLVFKKSLHNLSPEYLGLLRGLIAYARSIEPEFVESLRKKYGAAIVDN